MSFGVSGKYQRGVLRCAALILLGGAASGCSSDVMRFENSILTGSSHRTAAIAPASQPYPGDMSGLDATYTGSVAGSNSVLTRGTAVPIPEANVGGVQMASTPAAQQPYPAAPAPVNPSRSAALAPVTSAPLDAVTTSTVAAAPTPSAPEQPAPPAAVASRGENREGGWSAGGGTRISVRQGETVYNLSRRFGVPVKAIQEANGLSDASQLAAGQEIVIPTFAYAPDVPVSAPDANPKVAAARPTGLPAGAPVPQDAPDRVAALPQQPTLDAGEAPAQAAASSGRTYTVSAGDTLNAIAGKTGVSAEALKQANGMSSGLIRIGQTLIIPDHAPAVQTAAASVDQTTTGTTPAAQVTAYTPPSQPAEPIQAAVREAAAPAPDSTGVSKLRWPVQGRIVAPFGTQVAGRPNDGIDIAVPKGTPIKSAENGVVIYAGDGLKDFGNTVLVRHEDGLVTVYGHAEQIKVSRGEKVVRGQEIAVSGMSGSAETPRLHFEVRKESAPVNPTKYLE